MKFRLLARQLFNFYLQKPISTEKLQDTYLCRGQIFGIKDMYNSKIHFKKVLSFILLFLRIFWYFIRIMYFISVVIS